MRELRTIATMQSMMQKENLLQEAKEINRSMEEDILVSDLLDEVLSKNGINELQLRDELQIQLENELGRK